MNPYDQRVEVNSRDRFSRFASEFSGTFILIASIKLAIASSSDLAPLTIGFTLMVIVYLHGHNSLGMFNPSVLIAHIIRNQLLHGLAPNIIEIVLYLLAQILGAIGGGVFISFCFSEDACRVHTYVQPDVKAFEALCGELMFCTILVMANMHCAANKKTKGNQFYGLTIGSVLFVSAVTIGGKSGSAINLAVWIGTVASADLCMTPVTRHWWIYFVAHIAAGIYSGVYYTYIHPDNRVRRMKRVRTLSEKEDDVLAKYEDLDTVDGDKEDNMETDEEIDNVNDRKKGKGAVKVKVTSMNVESAV